MAKLSIGQKAARTLVFIIGIRHPRARRALAAHGFTDAHLDEGWALLRGLTTTRLDTLPPVFDVKLLRQLDEWENKWFPIAGVVLRANYPAAHELVFRNLTQTDGAEVVVSVSTFVDRLDVLAQPTDKGGLGRDGRAARALLAKRGLDDGVVESARDLLTKIGTTEDHDAEITEIDPEEQKTAELKLWNWYLEWGGIARTVIADRRLLRMLGFLAPTRSSDGNTIEDEEVDEDEQDEEESDEDGVDVLENEPAAPTPAEPNEPA
jgi:hypothetical protein